MEIYLTPESEARLADLARTQGKDPAEIAGELVALGLEQERTARKKREIAGMLDRRWQDYKSGRVQPVDGEEVFARLRHKISSGNERLPLPARSRSRPARDLRLHLSRQPGRC